MIFDCKSFGNLMFCFNNVDSLKYYYVWVLFKDKLLVVIFNYVGVFFYIDELKLLFFGDYLLEIIDDCNVNGCWDVGCYDIK